MECRRFEQAVVVTVALLKVYPNQSSMHSPYNFCTFTVKKRLLLDNCGCKKQLNWFMLLMVKNIEKCAFLEFHLGIKKFILSSFSWDLKQIIMFT
jgi:hypothetical protein